MIRRVFYPLGGASLGAAVFYLLAEGLPEGAIMGGILGGSAGILIAMWLSARRDAKTRAIRGQIHGTRSFEVIEKEKMFGPRGQSLHGPYR